jgi:hypothetical protein
MPDTIQRGLSDREQRGLRRERDLLASQRKRILRFTLGGCALTLAIGIPAAIGQWRQETGLGVLALVVVCVFLGIFAWTYRCNVGDVGSRERQLDQALQRGHAVATRYRPQRYVAVEEIEDEGAEFFLELQPGQTLYLGGQHYYGINKFPNADFELVELRSPDGVVDFRVDCHGDKLQPERTIGKQAKLQMLKSADYPQDGDTLPYSLDELEQRLL